VLALGACTSPSASESESPSPSGEEIVNPSPTPTDTTPAATPTPTPTPIPVSTTLDGITVTNGRGDEPQIDVPAPWAIDSTKTKVITEGTGRPIPDGAYVYLNYVGVNGRTGEIFDSSWVTPTPPSPDPSASPEATASATPFDDTPVANPAVFSLAPGRVVAGFSKGIVGQKEGSRVLIAMPGSDGYDSAGGQTDAGIEVGDTLVFVVDIIMASYNGPEGETVTPPAGLPVVTDMPLTTASPTPSATPSATPTETATATTAPVLVPTITFPDGIVKPTELTVQPLIKGAGPAVKAGDSILVNYTEYVWGGDKPVRQTYGDTAQGFGPLAGTLATTIPGWQTGLLGQTAGSRVLLIVPPDQAYPQGNTKIGVATGSTMVYVIDILFALS